MKRNKLFLLVLALMLILLAACGTATATTEPPAAASPTLKPTSVPVEPAASTSSMSEIMIDAADYSYTAPETVSAGWVRVTLTNSGDEPHHVQFLRLNDGVTVQQFEEALKQAEGRALAMTQQMGGVGAVAPGMSAQAEINLTPGEYVILCLIPSPNDHVAHHAKGMIKSLTVEAGSNSASEPKADLTVHMADFKYDLPESLPTGPLTIQVINDGPEPHEFNILKLAEGKTLQDVTQFLNGAGGPPPFVPVGGMNGLDKGLTGYAELNLEPGNYVAICNIPSPKAEGHPHFALGMIKEFSVGSAASSNFPAGKFIKSGTTDYGLAFNKDGTFSVFQGDNTFVHGTYSVDGDIFTETSNTGGCNTNVSFKYSFDGKNLTFNYVGNPEDDKACDGRHADFNNVIYKPGFPAGKYVEPGNDQAGLQFNDDGTWLAFNGPYTQAKGAYSVDGDTYTEESNNVGCPSPMSFKYTFDGTHLTFNYIGNPADDYSCDGRRAGFDNVTYTLSN